MKRPEPIGIIPHYESKHGRHPETVRVTFADGTTAVYEQKPESPHPQCKIAIAIIREMQRQDEEWLGYTPPRYREG